MLSDVVTHGSCHGHRREREWALNQEEGQSGSCGWGGEEMAWPARNHREGVSHSSAGMPSCQALTRPSAEGSLPLLPPSEAPRHLGQEGRRCQSLQGPAAQDASFRSETLFTAKLSPFLNEEPGVLEHTQVWSENSSSSLNPISFPHHVRGGPFSGPCAGPGLVRGSGQPARGGQGR